MNQQAVKKHRLNQDFVWDIPQAPYAIITERQADDYRKLGGFVLTDAFTAAELAPVVEALDLLESEANAALADAPEGPTISRHNEIVFSAHVVTRSAIARQFSLHPVFQALCRDLIGERARLYWDQLVYKRPGTPEEFPWHQDTGYTFVEPQHYLTCWVALSDATIENGCPWLATGRQVDGTLAHRWTGIGFQCLDEVVDAQPLEVKAGSIAVFASVTPHRTGPNLTQTTRKAYILQYAPDGAVVFPPDGEQFLANDPDRQYLVTGDA